MSRLSPDAGEMTSSCCAFAPLRSRVRKSEMGSVIDMSVGCSFSPARLGHAGDVALVRQLPQADPADAELAVDGASASAPTATAVAACLVLGCPLLAADSRNHWH